MLQDGQQNVSGNRINTEISNDKWEGIKINGLIKKSLKWGVIVSVISIMIAPFGLSIALVEFLAPVLMPSRFVAPLLFYIFGLISPNLILEMSWLFIGIIVIFNVVVYSIFIFSILIIRERIKSIKVKLFAILLTILVFLFISGMFANLYYFIISPNKSWIFMIGA